jgi:methionyl-tRNA synthetase
MVHKYFSGVVPESDAAVESELDLGLESKALDTIAEFETHMRSFAFNKAIAAIWGFINHMNKYVDLTAPWVLAKKKSSRKQLEIVIYNLLESLRIVSGLVYPIMPETAQTMQTHLGIVSEKQSFSIDILKKWKTLIPGTRVPKSITLFPRIDPKKESVALSEKKDAGDTNLDIKPEITIKELNKIDLRVATVIHAEAIPRAKKLLKLDVDMGERRTIVAGISETYAPEDLEGKQVVIVANLKPTKLMGILSSGMLLAAVEKDGCAVATLDRKMKPGTTLS